MEFNRLKVSKEDDAKKLSEPDLEELNMLLTDIHITTEFVVLKVNEYKIIASNVFDSSGSDQMELNSTCSAQEKESNEECYVNEMTQLQFGM